MNLFILDTDPVKAAHYHNDRHVAKAILELCQMLSMAHVYIDGHKTANRRIPDLVTDEFNMHHPCSLWVREVTGNYEWAYALLDSLAQEFTYRFDKLHAYDGNETARNRKNTIYQLKTLPLNIPKGGQTPFPRLLPREFRQEDTIESYRRYYFETKQHIASWTKRGEPAWWMEMNRTKEMATWVPL